MVQISIHYNIPDTLPQECSQINLNEMSSSSFTGWNYDDGIKYKSAMNENNLVNSQCQYLVKLLCFFIFYVFLISVLDIPQLKTVENTS